MANIDHAMGRMNLSIFMRSSFRGLESETDFRDQQSGPRLHAIRVVESVESQPRAGNEVPFQLGIEVGVYVIPARHGPIAKPACRIGWIRRRDQRIVGLIHTYLELARQVVSGH